MSFLEKILNQVQSRFQNRKSAIQAPTEEEIRCLAYLKWEAAGCPESNGDEFWIAAQKELTENAVSS